MVCCFTGHRNIEKVHMLNLPHALDYQLERLIVCGVDTFRCGGAVGFDTLAALKVLEKKNKYPFIKLELILPCENQTQNWGQRSKEIYYYILSRADRVQYIAKSYTKSCMMERNRKLVDGSDFCITYCKSGRSGTSYTCDYAKKKEVDLINLFDMLNN